MGAVSLGGPRCASAIRARPVSVPGGRFVSTVIERLSQRYPQIVFHFVIASIEELHRELGERNVDVVIVQRLGPIADERLEFEFAFDAAFVVAAGAQNPWARRRRVGLAELVNEPWTLPPRTTVLGSIAVEAFRASALEYPRKTAFILPTEVRINMLMTGRCLTILADFALRFPARRSEIKVLPIELPLDRVQVGIVTLKNRTLSPVVRLFIDAAHDVAKVDLAMSGYGSTATSRGDPIESALWGKPENIYSV